MSHEWGLVLVIDTQKCTIVKYQLVSLLQNLAYFAVQEMLVTLTPNFDHWDQHTIQTWIRKLHKVGSVIETVLNFKTEPGSDAEELKITNR